MKRSNKEWELLARFDQLGLDPGVNHKTGEPYPDFTEEEKIEMARSFEHQNNEFAREVVERGGPTLSKYVTPEKVEGVALVEKEGRYAGQYVHSYGKAAEIQARLEQLGTPPVNKKRVQDDNIILYGTEGKTGDTAAHEFMHMRDKDQKGVANAANVASHVAIYAELGWRARTKDEWDDTVNKYHAFINESLELKVDKKEAEENLKEQISLLEPDFLEADAQAESQFGLVRPQER